MGDEADLYSLIEQFKGKAGIPSTFNGRLNGLFALDGN